MLVVFHLSKKKSGMLGNGFTVSIAVVIIGTLSWVLKLLV